MNPHKSLRAWLAISASLAAVGVPLTSIAQQQVQADFPAASQLEEIVVTARRREENLQTVPIAITAFTQDDLDTKRAFALRDVSSFTPSLNLSQNTSDAFTPFSANLILRGLPGAVTYFSQVPTGGAGQSGGAGSTAVPGHYMDLALLEIDKGPQGTLFGTNAIGGAILLEPRRPTNAVEGYGEVTFGNYANREFTGALNVPVVSDKLLVRVAGQIVKRDGYTKLFNSSMRLDERDYQSWRVGVTLKPSESIENYLVYDGFHQHQHGSNGILSAVDPSSFVNQFFPTLRSLLAQQQALGPRTQIGRSIPAISKAKVWGVTDVLTWNVADDVTLKNVAAVRFNKGVAPIDMDGTAFPILDVGPANAAQLARGWYTNEKQYSEELQLQGRSFGDQLSWTVGAFLLYQGPAGFASTPSTALGQLSITEPAHAHRSRAVYAQGVYDLGAVAEGLRFTGGFRYNWDFVSNQTRAYSGATGACSNGIFTDANCVQHASAKFSAPGWTLGLDYEVAPGTLVYVRSGHAYVAGNANLNTPTPEFVRVNPQKVTDLEVGIKSDWSLGAVKGRTNANLFRTWFDDIAVQKLVSFTNAAGVTVVNSTTVNAASATVKGAELEATVIPVSGLELQGHGSYIFTKYGEYPVAAFGRPAPAILYVPRWQYGFSGTWHLPLDRNVGDIALTASYTWTGRQYISPDANPFNILPSYGKLDLRASWKSILASNFDLALYMTNATNRTYAQGAYTLYSQLGFGTFGYAEPRMYGLQLRYSFGQ